MAKDYNVDLDEILKALEKSTDEVVKYLTAKEMKEGMLELFLQFEILVNMHKTRKTFPCFKVIQRDFECSNGKQLLKERF